MRERWQRFIVWLVVLIFGAWPPELRVVFFRRWIFDLAFRCRWYGLHRVSNLLWWFAKIGARESTQPAMAAYSSKLLMNAIIEGRE